MLEGLFISNKPLFLAPLPVDRSTAMLPMPLVSALNVSLGVRGEGRV